MYAISLNAAQRVRHGELMEKLHASVVGQRELRDGYSFDLGPDAETFVSAAEWITLERRCCPFLVSKSRTETRPRTTTGSPFRRQVAAFSASFR